MNGPDYLAHFSSRGPTADGRLKPDVVAPGLYVKSASSVPDEVGECDDTTPPGLELKAGTSMSAPIVAGVAILVRQYFVEGWYPDGKKDETRGFQPRGSLVKAVIINGAEALLGIEESPGRVKESVPYDIHQGFGRVNLLSSLPLLGKNDLNALVVNGETIGNGGRHKYVVTIDKEGGCNHPLSATLAWTDPDVSPFCNECVLNDLDLYITKEGAMERNYPNGLSNADSTNNIERVRIENPEDEVEYTLHIEGFDLLGTQEYSLVVTGCFAEESVSEQTLGGSASPETEGLLACRDGRGDVMIRNDQVEDCAWLSSNVDKYGYLCQFVAVASECAATCNFCDYILSPTFVNGAGPVLSTSSDFQGDYRWYGVTFDVQAENDVTITGIDIHTALKKDYSVKIFSRAGSISEGSDEWTKVCDTTVQGMGEGSPTTIPPEDFASIQIVAGQSRSLYISLEEPDLVLDRRNLNGYLFENPDLKLGQGKAVTPSSGSEYPNFLWTGRLHYSLSNTVDAIPAKCEDHEGDIFIDPYVGTASCEWLSENTFRFEHTCTYVQVAVHCPKTCRICYLLAP